MSKTRTEHDERKTNALLWIAMLGPGVVWVTYLGVAYVLVHLACKTGNQAPLHIASAVFLVASLLCGLLAWIERPASSEPAGDMADKRINRIRLMTSIGMMSGIEFALIIAGSWIAMFILNPCLS